MFTNVKEQLLKQLLFTHYINTHQIQILSDLIRNCPAHNKIKMLSLSKKKQTNKQLN